MVLLMRYVSVLLFVLCLAVSPVFAGDICTMSFTYGRAILAGDSYGINVDDGYRITNVRHSNSGSTAKLSWKVERADPYTGGTLGSYSMSC